jgi:hypothetical protein
VCVCLYVYVYVYVYVNVYVNVHVYVCRGVGLGVGVLGRCGLVSVGVSRLHAAAPVKYGSSLATSCVSLQL